MGAPKGTIPPNAGKGRPKGVPNKATTEFREVVQRLIDENRDNVSSWLSRVAETDPDKALDLVAKLAEYVTPKLARHEHKVPDGAAVMSGTVFFVSGEKEGK